MTINLILLAILGLFILLISANYLIENIVSLAKKINISKNTVSSSFLKINKNQIFEIPDLPITLFSLIEKINIQLIKQRYNYQSKVFLKNFLS